MRFRQLLVFATSVLLMVACSKDDETPPEGHLFKLTVVDGSNNVHPNLDIDVNVDGFTLTTFSDDVPGRYEYYYYFEDHNIPTGKEIRFYASDGPLIGRTARIPISQYTDARVFNEELVLLAPGTLNIDLDNTPSERTILVVVEDPDDPNSMEYNLVSPNNYPIVQTINHLSYGNEDYLVSWQIYNNGALDETGQTTVFVPAGGSAQVDIDF